MEPMQQFTCSGGVHSGVAGSEVDIRAAVQRVVAFAADHRVVPRLTKEAVVAGIPGEGVPAIPSEQLVISVAAQNRVVASPPQITSSPPPPRMRLSPASPAMMSRPAVPKIVSLPAVPTTVGTSPPHRGGPTVVVVGPRVVVVVGSTVVLVDVEVVDVVVVVGMVVVVDVVVVVEVVDVEVVDDDVVVGAAVVEVVVEEVVEEVVVVGPARETVASSEPTATLPSLSTTLTVTRSVCVAPGGPVKSAMNVHPVVAPGWTTAPMMNPQLEKFRAARLPWTSSLRLWTVTGSEPPLTFRMSTRKKKAPPGAGLVGGTAVLMTTMAGGASMRDTVALPLPVPSALRRRWP
jgi:hypothetical protein